MHAFQRKSSYLTAGWLIVALSTSAAVAGDVATDAVAQLRARCNDLDEVAVIYRRTVEIAPDPPATQPAAAVPMRQLQDRFFDGLVTRDGCFRLTSADVGAPEPQWDGHALIARPHATRTYTTDGNGLLMYRNDPGVAEIGFPKSGGDIAQMIDETREIRTWLKPDVLDPAVPAQLVSDVGEGDQRIVTVCQDASGFKQVVHLSARYGFLPVANELLTKASLPISATRYEDYTELKPGIWRAGSMIDIIYDVEIRNGDLVPKLVDGRPTIAHRTTVKLLKCTPRDRQANDFFTSPPPGTPYVYTIDQTGKRQQLQSR